VFAPSVVRAYPLSAQYPNPSYPGQPQASAQPSTVASPYRSPTIALVQPAPGASIAQDKPVLVLRFAQGEPTDPLDVRSLTIAVNGIDRTALFQVGATEAWGPIAPMQTDGTPGVQPGVHQLVARICSSRGACGAVATTVTVLPAPILASGNMPTSGARPSKKQRLLDALIAAGRRLLVP
jgi:hypothetical protein